MNLKKLLNTLLSARCLFNLDAVAEISLTGGELNRVSADQFFFENIFVKIPIEVKVYLFLVD